jgi:hypothetical protein
MVTCAAMPNATVDCGKHGTQPGAVVCRHLVDAKDRDVGFVENSSEPDDLQAWCDDCEAMFEREGGEMTEAFKAFHDIKIVCDFCYAQLRERYARIDRTTLGKPDTFTLVLQCVGA